MKKNPGVVLSVLVLLAVAFLLAGETAFADEQKLVGVITRISMTADGSSADATIKDKRSGAEVVVYVTDTLTLDKFKDRRLLSGDQVRVKYESKNGKNLSRYFKKTAGD